MYCENTFAPTSLLRSLMHSHTIEGYCSIYGVRHERRT